MYKPLLIALAAVAACGGRTPADAKLPDGMGGIRVAMHTTTLPGTVMGEIIIQNAFDPSQTQVVPCTAKPETLDGLVFCDEMSVLPPGVYDIKFESQTGCQMTQDHYKALVQAGQTAEVQIDLVCDAATGGLDVIVTENHPPQVDNISFRRGLSPANKFICATGQTMETIITFEDAETPCDQITFQYSVNGVYWDYLTEPPPPPVWVVYGDAMVVDPVNNICELREFIDPEATNATPGIYNLDVALSDGKLTTTFSWPVHVIDCPAQ